MDEIAVADFEQAMIVRRDLRVEIPDDGRSLH